MFAVIFGPVAPVPALPTPAPKPRVILRTTGGKAVKQDERLATRSFTCQKGQVFVGELLELMSQETDVQFTASDKDKATGLKVVVFVSKRKLSDVMDDLTSLLSAKNAPWYWEQSKTRDGKYTYRLVQSEAAYNFGEKLRQEIHEDFATQVEEAIGYLDKPKSEWGDAARRNGELKQAYDSDYCFTQLKSFAESLSPEVRRAMMTGSYGESAPYIIPIDKISPATKKWGDDYIQMMRTHNPTIPIPDYKFSRFNYSMSPDYITPVVMMGVGNNEAPRNTPYVTFSLAGGGDYETQWRKRVNARWLTPGDSMDALSYSQKSRLPENAAHDPDKERELVERLREFSEAFDVPVFARLLRPKDTPKFAALTKKTLGDAVTGLRKKGLFCKWRGDALLLAAPRAMYNPIGEYASWAQHADLRKRIATNPTHRFTLYDLLHIAATFTAEDLKVVSDSNDTESASLRLLGNLPPWQELLVTLKRNPEHLKQALSPPGFPARILPEPVRDAIRKATGKEVIGQDVMLCLRYVENVDFDDPRNDNRTSNVYCFLREPGVQPTLLFNWMYTY